jgi:hypothetical protein
MIALPMHGWADVERILGQTPVPGPNTIDPHSGCDKSLSPWPSSLWPSIRFTGKHMGTERPARHLRQGLLHSNLDTTHPFAPMISDLDIWRAANLLIRQHGDDAELAAARRADLMHAVLWTAVWTFGPSLNAVTSKGKPSGSGSDGLSPSCKCHRLDRHIEPRAPGRHRVRQPRFTTPTLAGWPSFRRSDSPILVE